MFYFITIIYAEFLPLSLSLLNFQKNGLLALSLIYKHTFSLNKFFVWNNRDSKLSLSNFSIMKEISLLILNFHVIIMFL